ncbi:MAG: serine/threonine-protein phosphatase [Ferruginibacter sp.]|nr:serine/threonine-protein phosphatase [Ferruginibacter sp.]
MAEYFFGITDKGKRRDSNEDTFAVQEIDGGEWLIACVVDGVGGYEGGEIAAGIAREVLLHQLQDIAAQDVIKMLKQAVAAANMAIMQEKKSSDLKEMACVLTCVLAHVNSNKCWYAHVGDTRLYLCRDRSLVKISKDHSAVGFLEETGRLSEEDAMRHPKRNEINKALGFEEAIGELPDYIETGASPFLPGDLLLLCSDGLSDMIASATILSILINHKNLGDAAQMLIDAANEAGGNDNVTVVLLANSKEPKPQVAFLPVEKKIATGKSTPNTSQGSSIEQTIKIKRSHKRLTALLSLLSLALVLALVVSLFKNSIEAKKNNNALKMIPGKKKDDLLLHFMSAINDSTHAYTLGISLKIAAPVFITKDSFHLKGNGLVISADSNYKGAAFIVGNTAKEIVLDSLIFQNFDVALRLQKNNVTLRHIRFINCRVPVQYELSFPDTIISGRFTDTFFLSNSTYKK